MKDMIPCKWMQLPPGSSRISCISFLERGGGRGGKNSAVILLHGRGGKAADMLEVMELLAPDHFCIAPNMPGAYAEGSVAESYDNENIFALTGLLKKLEIPRIIFVTAGDSYALAAGFAEISASGPRIAGIINIGDEQNSSPAGIPVLCLAETFSEEENSEQGVAVEICDTASPPAVAAAIKKGAEDFFGAEAEARKYAPAKRPGKMRLHKLFDFISPGSVFVIVILRLLQFIRRLQGRSAKPYGGGWRKLTKVFLGSEYSKFMLGCFRLTYAPAWGIPQDRDSAAVLLAGRFAEFLMRTPELHWHVVPGRFSFALKRSFFCDVVEVHTDALGHITRLVPHFDARHSEWLGLKSEQLDIALTEIISTYNRCRKLPSALRPRRIAEELRKWCRKGRGLSRSERKNMKQVVERIMSAAVIFCEQKKDDLPEHNTAMPDMKRYRHPGWGMISIVARFSADLTEADLWCQFNHVTADGAPMQEALMRLKRNWGSAGETIYPALTSIVSRPESVYCGDGIFRSRVFADFSGLLALRRRLNGWLERKDASRDSVSLAALVLWGMSRHPYFSKKKILLPVDVRNSGKGAADLDIMVIRPGLFRDGKGELNGFIRFNEELNRKLENIRSGNSESGEFLELCAMLHPLLYRFAGIIMRKELQEIVGTVGLSILRDAEMFVSPLTDFQRNGFMTIGAVSVNTVNGKKAGAVSICGSREQIRSFLEALKGLFTDFVDDMGKEISAEEPR